MAELKKKAARTRGEDTASVIARYEAMSSEAIEAELKANDIDPGPTIAAVNALVRERLDAWRGSVPAMKKRGY